MTNAVTPIEPLFPAHCQTVKSSIELCKVKLAKASTKERAEEASMEYLHMMIRSDYQSETASKQQVKHVDPRAKRRRS
jgi:hypothetical protein